MTGNIERISGAAVELVARLSITKSQFALSGSTYNIRDAVEATSAEQAILDNCDSVMLRVGYHSVRNSTYTDKIIAGILLIKQKTDAWGVNYITGLTTDNKLNFIHFMSTAPGDVNAWGTWIYMSTNKYESLPSTGEAVFVEYYKVK